MSSETDSLPNTLYFSKRCQYCSKLLNTINDSTKRTLNFIEVESGVPKYIRSVPSIVLSNNTLLEGVHAFKWIKSQQEREIEGIEPSAGCFINEGSFDPSANYTYISEQGFIEPEDIKSQYHPSSSTSDSTPMDPRLERMLEERAKLR